MKNSALLCDILDPQEDSEDHGDVPIQAHTDWLTLNVGGRCFTTTR